MIQKIKKLEKGITLIALVITIIVLLILAGVTITTLTGENGLLKRASNAAEATQKETATEKMNFKITNIQINTYAKEQRMPTLQEIADAFYEDNEIEYVELASQKTASKEKIEVGKNESIFTKLSEYPYEFEIDSSLRLASINGVKVADNSSSLEIEELKSTIDTLSEKIEKLESNQTTTNNEITSLKEKNQQLETINSSLQTKVSALENSSEISVTSISFTMPSSIDWSKVADYPTGYTRDNCIFIGGYFYYDGTHQNVIVPHGTDRTNDGYTVVEQRTDGIYMHCTSGYVNKSGKLFLQKIN